MKFVVLNNQQKYSFQKRIFIYLFQQALVIKTILFDSNFFHFYLI
jgi:hypothetical protein